MRKKLGSGTPEGMRPPNLATYVRRQLLKTCAERDLELYAGLLQLARERFVARLMACKQAEHLSVKGAVLLAAWLPNARATNDLNLHADDNLSDANLMSLLETICATATDHPDALDFLPQSLELTHHRTPSGLKIARATLSLRLLTLKAKLLLGITHNDAKVPPPQPFTLPAFMPGWPDVKARGSCVELLMAEKFHTALGTPRQAVRMQDLHDMSTLCETQTLFGSKLCTSLRKTFDCRVSSFPKEVPAVFTAALAQDPIVTSQWKSYARHIHLPARSVSLWGITQTLQYFFTAPLETMAKNHAFTKTWEPGGPWRSTG